LFLKKFGLTHQLIYLLENLPLSNPLISCGTYYHHIDINNLINLDNI